MSAIVFKDLKKTYKSRKRTVEALKGVSLEVEEGLIYGFIGPNGAGKSTTIKILVGLLRPDGGEASIFGHQCGSHDAKRCLGFLPEVANYHEFMTARELLGVHAALAGVPRGEVEQRCAECLDLVGLGERASSRISEFSKGMKQRVGVAQALVGQPRLLILDELTSGLDPMAQLELHKILSDLKQKGITIFFSSHHLSEVERLCDRVAMIHEGTLRKEGTIEEVLAGEFDNLDDMFASVVGGAS